MGAYRGLLWLLSRVVFDFGDSLTSQPVPRRPPVTLNEVPFDRLAL